MITDFSSFKIAARAVGRLSEIERLLGRWEAVERAALPPRLEHANLVRAAFDTVALSGGSSSFQQATRLLRGKRDLAASGEILALENAHAAYQRLAAWDPLDKSHLLEAHGVLMDGLLADAGKFRSGKPEAAERGRAKTSLPAARLGDAMKSLLRFARQNDVPPIITAIVFYAEVLRTRPFSDGNGRIARLWLHALLRRASPLFEHAPIESVLSEQHKAHDAEFATSLRASGDADYAAYGDAPLVEHMLELLLLALQRATGQLRGQRETADDRGAHARKALGKTWFSRKQYRALFPSLSTASASRDLANGLAAGALTSRGEHALTEYRFR